jgi:K+-transporting ATPase ATPase C chain
MKKYLIPSIRLTLVLMLLLCVLYPVFISFAGRFSEGQGGGEKMISQGKTVGYAVLGQRFDKPQYFWGRPSAVDYNAAGSAGSNKGPGNVDYLKTVSDRVDTLLKYHPYLKKSDIPADLVTASGSGLDPDISEQAALIQIKRVAKARKITEPEVAALLVKHTRKPILGIFGPSAVNVLKLNMDLDKIKSNPNH